MKKHTKIYLDYFEYAISDFIPCEVCGKVATDVHHIQPRGMGGSKHRDVIENLMALCRGCHHEADFGTKLSQEYLGKIHAVKLKKT